MCPRGSTAIEGFVSALSEDRAILASRSFRGPRQLGWPKFRILPLTDQRRRKLVKQSDAEPEVQRQVTAGLASSGDRLGELEWNPLFVGLLLEYVAGKRSFPETVQQAFASYVSARFERDERRLGERFGASSTDVRAAAEAVAYCMLRDPRLGLTVTASEVEGAAALAGVGIPGELRCLRRAGLREAGAHRGGRRNLRTPFWDSHALDRLYALYESLLRAEEGAKQRAVAASPSPPASVLAASLAASKELA